MKLEINKLSRLFKAMVNNYHIHGSVWKNIELGKQAFAIMKSLPPTVEGEFESPAEKAELLVKMLDLMDETSTPRFCIEVREYIHSLNPDNENNTKELHKLKDFINLSLSMEDYCVKYRKHLKFDPVERTEKWENIIFQVEKECNRILKNHPRGMGFCFMYWSVMSEILERHGIHWCSPAQMNPGVMFD